MFQQLVPLLRQRSVLLTVTLVEDDQVRVNVMPKKIAESENTALTIPMSFTGTAGELDEQLPAAISSFVASHLEMKNTLERAKEEMAAAAKAAPGRGPQQGEERQEGQRHSRKSNSHGEEGRGKEGGGRDESAGSSKSARPLRCARSCRASSRSSCTQRRSVFHRGGGRERVARGDCGRRTRRHHRRARLMVASRVGRERTLTPARMVHVTSL
jgi:PRTRC genetic system protein E